MKHLLLILGAMLLAVVGCTTAQTGETVPNWPAIHAELGFTQTDLTNLAAIVDDPKAKEIINLTSAVIGDLEKVLGQYIAGEPVDVVEAIALALERLPEVTQATSGDPDDVKQMKFVVLALQATLRRWVAYG